MELLFPTILGMNHCVSRKKMLGKSILNFCTLKSIEQWEVDESSSQKKNETQT